MKTFVYQLPIRFCQDTSKTEKPVVLVLVQGRPRVISKKEGLVSGILFATYPENKGGRVISEIFKIIPLKG